MSNPPAWPFVRSEWHDEEVDSTNDWARRLVEAGDLNRFPALVWANRQTRGRGQGANAWWSDDGSLTASVVIDPEAYDLAVAIRPRVALAVAVAVVEAIAAVVPGCAAGIRWPNDVEVFGRKLGGILVEGVSSPAGPRLIVGMGLNVASRVVGAPTAVREMAASLAEFGAGVEECRAILSQILGRLEPILHALASGDPRLELTWNRLDTLRGTVVRVQVGDREFTAIAEGIDSTGGLRIRRNDLPEILYAGRILRD